MQVCDPHRIAEKKDGCLVYSVGSEGKFEFELSVLNEIHQQCEVHTFDPHPSYADNAPENIHYHSWGFASEKSIYNGNTYKSLKQTIDELGHRDRVIDIFKIDCEGCEWTTVREWFFPNVYESTILKQILVEVHNVPNEADSFFRYLQKQGYVTFHKEPNIKFAGGDCVEYALLNLDKSFFEGMTFTIDESYPPVPAPVESAAYTQVTDNWEEPERVTDNWEEPENKSNEKVLKHFNSTVDEIRSGVYMELAKMKKDILNEIHNMSPNRGIQSFNENNVAAFNSTNSVSQNKTQTAH